MLEHFEANVESALNLAYDACEATSDYLHCESLLLMLRRHTAKFEKLSESWQPPMKTTSGGAEILFPNWDVRPANISSPNRLQTKRLPEREILEQRIADKHSKAEKARVARESQLQQKAQEREARIKEASNRVNQKLDRVRCSTESRHGKALQAREDHLNSIRTRASLETAKVKEVAFITSMTEIMKATSMRQQLDQRLTEGKARHEYQLSLRQQPAQAATKWAEAVTDKRKAMQEETKLKLTEIDSKQKAAELRRQKIKETEVTAAVPDIRWCVVCKVKLAAEYVENHIAGKKHVEAAGESELAQPIIPFVEEGPVVSEFMAPVNTKARKKKAQKLKKLMAAEDRPTAELLQGAPNTPLKSSVEHLLKTSTAPADSDQKDEPIKVSVKSLRDILTALEQEEPSKGSALVVYTALADVLIPVMISAEDSKTAATAYKIVSLLCEKAEVGQHLVKEHRAMVALIDAAKRQLKTSSDLCCILRLILGAGGDSASISLALRYIAHSSLLNQISEFFVEVAVPADTGREKQKKPKAVPADTPKRYLHLVQFLATICGLPELVNRAGPVFEPRTSDVGQVLVGVLKETAFAGLLSVMEVLALRPDVARRPEQELDLFDETVMKTLEDALQTLNNIGRVDMLLLQRFSSENQVQLYHIVGLLLRYCTVHEEGSGGLLNQLILFIGYCTLLNQPNQSAYRWGKAPVLLQRLCNLPFVFFLHDEHRQVLLPTLIACCFRNEPNLQVLRNEINAGHCVDFIKQALKAEARPSSSVFDFDQRFPKHLWEEAIEFFQQEPSS